MPELAFTVLAVISVAAALLSLEAREIVYGAISLVIMLLSIAGFFIILDAPFVAMFQLIIYVGAVAVLILFTVMLVRREKWIKTEVEGLNIIGILGGLAVGLTFGLLLLQSTLGSVTAGVEVASFLEIGIQIMSEYWAALEILALLLAASLIGALTLAKIDKEE